jgi:hypothetical protein
MTSKRTARTRKTEPSSKQNRTSSVGEPDRRRIVWLSIRGASDRAEVCPRTIKRWISGGLLPATRLPSPKGMGHLRIRLGDLEALVARGALQ